MRLLTQIVCGAYFAALALYVAALLLDMPDVVLVCSMVMPLLVIFWIVARVFRHNDKRRAKVIAILKQFMKKING